MALARLCCWYKLRECNSVRHSRVPPPPYRHYRHCPPPSTIRLCSLRSAWPGQAVLTSAGSVAAGSDGCLLGRNSLPPVAMSVCAFVLLRCFPVLTLSLPKEHSMGIIFFSSLSSCKCCIFLQFYLHFTTDYTCMIVYVTNNKEPLERPLGSHVVDIDH